MEEKIKVWKHQASTNQSGASWDQSRSRKNLYIYVKAEEAHESQVTHERLLRSRERGSDVCLSHMRRGPCTMYVDDSRESPRSLPHPPHLRKADATPQAEGFYIKKKQLAQ